MGPLGLVLDLADVRALDGVDEVPGCEVEEEGLCIEPHEDGEEQEGGTTGQLHFVRGLPVESQKHTMFEPISRLVWTGSPSVCTKQDTRG